MCKYVEKDEIYAVQPDGQDYEYYFDQYTYDKAYDVNHWYDGQKINSNSFTVEFATDDSASFYGFKLEWEPWEVDPCLSDSDKCGNFGTCENLGQSQYTCSCNEGYQLDNAPNPTCTKVERVLEATDLIDFDSPESKTNGNWYIALEKKFQEKLKTFLNPKTAKSVSEKRPKLVTHIYERIKNAIRKSFYGVVRKCEVPLSAQTNGKKFRGTLFQLKRANGLAELSRLFDQFLTEKYDQRRCRARQAKLSGKTGRFIRWAINQTTAPE